MNSKNPQGHFFVIPAKNEDKSAHGLMTFGVDLLVVIEREARKRLPQVAIDRAGVLQVSSKLRA